MPWEPITDLPPDHRALASDELRSLGELWRERADELGGTGALRDFVVRLQDEIVVAVHRVGRPFRGGVSAVAFSLRREPDEEGRRTTRVLSLAREPSSFTDAEDEAKVRGRLAGWLEPTLLMGVDAFRRAIANGG